ncbi:glycine betaine ABC transporter substrate-binding protein, partial [Mammaliicoccus fleurettii]|nr:glycine betaine ABC transporter substrate-binding protein [Mammaliicoccus fleurettii]
TVLGELTKETPKSTSEKGVYEQANNSLDKKFDMQLLEPMKYNNTYALAVKKEYAKKHDIKTISDLKKVENDIRPGFTLEFNDREDGYKGIQKKYDLNFKDVKTMEPKLRYQALESKDIDLIDAYSTDAELKEYGMVVLEDDKKLFPPYQGAPLMKKETVKEHPEVVKAMNKLKGKISDEEMQEMNHRVTIKDEDAYQVAKEYLEKNDLIN